MLLRLNNVSKGYGVPGSHAFRPVLKNLSWQAEAGSRICIAGPSGSGKTTLLNLIGALDRPDTGEIMFGDRDISKYSADELAQFRNRSLGFVFQQHLLLPQLTLMENVLLPLLPAGNSASSEKRSWAEHLLKKTGIWEQRDQKPSQMSGGECQRTAVVRAMINKPSLILADEPTGALDETNATILADLLINLSREEGITLITVTHSSELAAKMDRLFHLRHGRLES
ncbi:ABC-type lipoprotein export system, ATPase component [Bacteroidales bacterium 6E]|nr:ABC-type lipoprotein export system, ATPase component [Bacteroidales bacterium 6E]